MERGRAGGRQVLFQQSWELEMSMDKNSDFSLVSRDPAVLETRGKRLKIACYKNSFGETKRPPIHISIHWQYRVLENGEVRQYTRWDWPSSLVDLLLSFTEGRAKKIESVVDIRPTTGSLFYSTTLGIAKADAITKTELGRRIEANPEIVQGLRRMLAIKRVEPFHYGSDFVEQIAARHAEVDKANRAI